MFFWCMSSLHRGVWKDLSNISRFFLENMSLIVGRQKQKRASFCWWRCHCYAVGSRSWAFHTMQGRNYKECDWLTSSWRFAPLLKVLLYTALVFIAEDGIANSARSRFLFLPVPIISLQVICVFLLCIHFWSVLTSLTNHGSIYFGKCQFVVLLGSFFQLPTIWGLMTSSPRCSCSGINLSFANL